MNEQQSGMTKKFQAKDIPTLPILLYLNEREGPGGAWCCWADPAEIPSAAGRTIHEAVPSGMPPKVILAKMRSLVRKGLVDGCCCGCRGDFRITEDGMKWLAELQ